MKVFISWSGERSQALAIALRDWLPLVLHYVQPWLSEADIAAGDRWAQEVAKELDTSNFGIVCVTPENMGAPWLLFEAGALAKSMKEAKVVPLLLNLEFSDITGPLAQFQAKKVERVGLDEVIQSINHATDIPIPDERVKQLFAALWSAFEQHVLSIPKNAPTEKHLRPQHEIFEDLVSGVRGLDSRFRDLEGVVLDQGQRSRPRRMRYFHPEILEEIAGMVSDESDDPVILLVLASFLRDDFPWFYEIIIEAYREVRDGDHMAGQRTVERLHRVTRAFGRGPFMKEFSGSSKEAHMMMMELPMILDRFLHRFTARRSKVLPDPDRINSEESFEVPTFLRRHME
ncbi:MAG: toll/interleukin-1 receptor domain-containing protein [Magnetococcus sp. DMHC-8]